MNAKIYSLIGFLLSFWTIYLFWAFKNQKKISTPVDFFIFGRDIPGWAFVMSSTGIIFSGWIFFIHPSLVLANVFPYYSTSLCVILITIIGILFLKRQWMSSKRFGFVTPGEMLSTYFRSEILRILVVIITVGFAIPFIAMQLALGGLLIDILSDNVIGSGSGSLLIGSVIFIYLCLMGIRSTIYFDTIQFLLMI